MATFKKRVMDVRVGDHVETQISGTKMAVISIDEGPGLVCHPKMRLHYINMATGLDGFWDAMPSDMVIVHPWPYGSKSAHEECCVLHKGALECDCKASDASDDEWGNAWTPPRL